MKSVVIIPARYESSRFPGKPLALINKKPMLLWVAELSAKAVSKNNVYIATDDDRIGNMIENNGFNVIYTSQSVLLELIGLPKQPKVLTQKYILMFKVTNH